MRDGDENNDRVASVLDDLRIYYERERAFAGLTGDGGRPLRFDFYLPSKPQLCIEYQGPQHYPCGYGLHLPNGVDRMLRQSAHDAKKRAWCEAHLIPLLTILPGLSAATERALIEESIVYWRAYEERVRMGDEDRGTHVGFSHHPTFDVRAAKRKRAALNAAPLLLNFCK